MTTGALFVSCALAWPIFIGFLSGASAASVTPVLDWMQLGRHVRSTGRCASTR